MKLKTMDEASDIPDMKTMKKINVIIKKCLKRCKGSVCTFSSRKKAIDWLIL